MKNETKKTNATKTNEFLSIDKIEKLFDELTNANTKLELVNALNRYGLRTTTIPTTTPNKNDLYIQLFDKSRILFSSKSMKVYTSKSHTANIDKLFGVDTTNEKYIKNENGSLFSMVNDGSYRVRRATIAKTVDNFKLLFNYFAQNGCIEKLPTTV